MSLSRPLPPAPPSLRLYTFARVWACSYLSEAALSSLRLTGGQIFCSTASPTAIHLIPPGPATSDAMCKPGKVGGGTADGSSTMAKGSVAPTSAGRPQKAPFVRFAAIETSSNVGAAGVAAPETAGFVAASGDAAAVPPCSSVSGQGK